jgi:hypothetical protein
VLFSYNTKDEESHRPNTKHPQNGPLNHVFWGVFRIKGLPSNMDDRLMLKPTEVCGSKQALNLDRQHRRSTMWRRAKCLRTKLWTRLPCNRTGASAGSWPLSVSAGVNEQWDTSQPVSKWSNHIVSK